MLPLAAGLLLALAYPPASLLVPAFVGLVPLLVFIAERPAGPEGRWSATRAGVLTGVVYYGLQLYWLVPALAPRSALAVPAFVLSVAVLAGFTGVFACAVHYARERTAVPLVVLAAAFWTTLEWGLAHLGPLAYPWLGLGYALAPFPRLAGAAELVGVRGLTLWIAAVNGLVAMAVLRHRSPRSAAVPRPAGGSAATGPLLAATLLLVLTPVLYGLWRAATLELRPAARVGVVQPDIDQHIRRDHALALDTALVMLTRLTGRLEGRNLDLVVWPEVALPAELPGDGRLLTRIGEISDRVGAPIVAGAYGDDPAGGANLFNSAFLVTAGGADDARYDKRRLVPFVERVPFADLIRPAGSPGRSRYLGGLARGGAAPVFHPGGDAGRFGVLICYESAFHDLARQYRRDGADYLVNITNDGWFGRRPWYTRTTALWQHPAHMTLRAIENRMGVARAANIGFSMFIDPVGRTRNATALFVADVRSDIVLTTDAVTLFTRWGDWLATLAALTAAAILAASRHAGRAGRPS